MVHHVDVERVGGTERQATLAAHVGLLTRVDTAVDLHLAHVVKLLPAVPARVAPLARVELVVVVENGGRAESLPADVALTRLEPEVRRLVFLERVQSGEALIALRALQRLPVLVVARNVALEAGLLRAQLPTDLAPPLSVAMAIVHVFVQGVFGWEGAVGAVGALEGALVDPDHVAVEGAGQDERLAAVGTDVSQLPRVADLMVLHLKVLLVGLITDVTLEAFLRLAGVPL